MRLTDQIREESDRGTIKVLPTPTANENTGPSQLQAGGDDLRTVVSLMFPTPTVGNATGGNAQRGGDRSDEKLLPGLAEEIAGGLLPTPKGSDGDKGWPNQRGSSGDYALPAITNILASGRLFDYVAEPDAQLLPTPSAGVFNDGEDPAQWEARQQAMRDAGGDSFGMPLSVAAAKLLPTPVASEGVKATDRQNAEQKAKTGQVWLTNVAHTIRENSGIEDELGKVGKLLPTPLTTDDNYMGPADALRDTVQLRAITALLPTPTTQETHSGPSQANRNTPPLNSMVHDLVAPDVVIWGDYEPAIRRWERVIGRPAPAPTKATGRDGKQRLNPEFVEWMMGLNAGHVTGVPGLKRNAQLKALGNGVVPQQGMAAIAHLLGQQHLFALVDARRELLTV